MSTWRRFPKPAEPNENKGGFRKIQRGEGAARVFGGIGSNKVSDLKMDYLGGIFGALVLMIPVSMLLIWVFGFPWANLTFWGSFVLAHLFIIAAETITHREIPFRKWGMLVCWGSFLIRLTGNAVWSLP